MPKLTLKLPGKTIMKLPDEFSDLSASIQSGGGFGPLATLGLLLGLLLLILRLLLLVVLLEGRLADRVLHHVALSEEAFLAEVAEAAELGGVGLGVELFVKAGQ